MMSMRPRIVTASWSSDLPADYCRIGVSRGPPRRQRGYRRYLCLVPGDWMWTAGDREFVERYEVQLATLDPDKVVADLAMISAGHPVALLCFERVGTSDCWCHRSLIARWLNRTLRIEVVEFGYVGMGNDHPLLPPYMAFPIE